MKIRLHAACVLACAMIGAAAGEGEGRPKVVTTDYEGVSPAKLMAVYKKSYRAAGFQLKKQRTRVTDMGAQNITRLTFEIANPDHPRKKKGVLTLLISSSRAPSRCAPCRVHNETVDAPGYDGKGYGDFMSAIIAADHEAKIRIGAEMGK